MLSVDIFPAGYKNLFIVLCQGYRRRTFLRLKESGCCVKPKKDGGGQFDPSVFPKTLFSREGIKPCLFVAFNIS